MADLTEVGAADRVDFPRLVADTTVVVLASVADKLHTAVFTRAASRCAGVMLPKAALWVLALEGPRARAACPPLRRRRRRPLFGAAAWR